jgi:hypothetical protein
MPLFAKLFGSVASGFVALFAYFLSFKSALKLAAYTTWIVTFTAFLVAVFVCVSSLLNYLTGGISGGPSWVGYFGVGLGMFIPANASAVMSCVASVWIATNVYKVQKQGIFGFGS